MQPKQRLPAHHCPTIFRLPLPNRIGSLKSHFAHQRQPETKFSVAKTLPKPNHTSHF
ncbi:hypothetical protein [Kingella sp. (in: b-proteobacteria)]|uniref:hypothetical protein n=1 Tax=Kingella sp. (in: b-proteobacteria) TaxID=2020713 RepID=UPI0026DB8531|nr:hypothetical protein [Kingella sp. (in: b-proteobacteria)]MDO4657158.1 hypothetical protein [Kingella sp. (in: b-proteobacteria)]